MRGVLWRCLPGHRDDGAVGLVLGHDMGGGPGGGQHHDGRRLALVGGEHRADGRGARVVKVVTLLLGLLNRTLSVVSKDEA